jgi:hypothetical protein
MMLIAITPLPGAVAPGVQDFRSRKGELLISGSRRAEKFSRVRICQRLREKPNGSAESCITAMSDDDLDALR